MGVLARARMWVCAVKQWAVDGAIGCARPCAQARCGLCPTGCWRIKGRRKGGSDKDYVFFNTRSGGEPKNFLAVCTKESSAITMKPAQGTKAPATTPTTASATVPDVADCTKNSDACLQVKSDAWGSDTCANAASRGYCDG